MLCFSIVLWLRRHGKSAPKNWQVGRIGCPRCRRESDSEVKMLKIEVFGRLFEVQAAKICTTPWRESNWEVKIVKNLHDRSTF